MGFSGYRAGSSQNFTVFISLLAPFHIAFGALFTVATHSAPVCLEHVEHASSRPRLGRSKIIKISKNAAKIH